MGKPVWMVLLKSPVSPSLWPVANAEALAVVKVGNREWLFLKSTPSSRRRARVGAVLRSTIWERRPSGTKRTRLCGAACARTGSSSRKTWMARAFTVADFILLPGGDDVQPMVPGLL